MAVPQMSTSPGSGLSTETTSSFLWLLTGSGQPAHRALSSFCQGVACSEGKSVTLRGPGADLAWSRPVSPCNSLSSTLCASARAPKGPVSKHKAHLPLAWPGSLSPSQVSHAACSPTTVTASLGWNSSLHPLASPSCPPTHTVLPGPICAVGAWSSVTSRAPPTPGAASPAPALDSCPHLGTQGAPFPKARSLLCATGTEVSQPSRLPAEL